MSKYFHGFFITINSMILYFKHIIHIDDFPLNGHPPSIFNGRGMTNGIAGYRFTPYNRSPVQSCVLPVGCSHLRKQYFHNVEEKYEVHLEQTTLKLH